MVKTEGIKKTGRRKGQWRGFQMVAWCQESLCCVADSVFQVKTYFNTSKCLGRIEEALFR